MDGLSCFRLALRIAFTAGRSRGAGPSVQNCLDELFRRVDGRRRVLGGSKCRLLQLNRLAIAIEISDAPRAFSQMLVEFGALRGGERAGKIVLQELGDFGAGQSLAFPE